MIILGIDTATSATTVAVGRSGATVSRRTVDPHGHVESLAPMIAEVLDESNLSPADIDVVACGVGPGPFTGLRVGISTAIAMATTLNRPVVGVCTHDVIARATLAQPSTSAEGGDGELVEGVLVATTARRAETFVSTYDRNGVRSSGPIAVSNDDAREWILSDQHIVSGDAVPRLLDGGAPISWGVTFPDASDLIAIVQERHESGEGWPGADLAVAELDPATARGDSTAQVLLDRARRGRVLLPPRPLYLRAPDAVARPPQSVEQPGSGSS